MDVTGELPAQDALLPRETASNIHWYEAGWAPQPVHTYLGEEKISLTCWEWYHISSVAQTIGWSLQRLYHPDSFLVCTMGYIHIWIWQNRTGPIAGGFSCTDKITVTLFVCNIHLQQVQCLIHIKSSTQCGLVPSLSSSTL